MVKDIQNPNHTVVIGIEHIEDLAKLSKSNLKKSYANELSTGQIKIVCGDGREGYAVDAPYDVIHVGAAAPEVPQALVDQLKVDGVLIIPVGTKH